MQLFRQQALDHQHRLHGEVFLVPPLRWQAIGWLLLALVLALVLFLTLGSYSRTIKASGTLRPATSVASIALPDDGVIASVLVREGQPVREGQLIARIARPQAADGLSLVQERREALGQEEAALATQRRAAGEAIEENRRKLDERIRDEERQIGAIDRQIEAQEALIASSRQELARVEAVARDGFISGRDLQERRELLITRRQDLARLEQSRSLHANALTAARIERDQLASHLRAGQGSYDAQLAQVRREGATLANAGTIDLVAPRAGILTALRFREGESVARGTIYGRIVPPGTGWLAELRVPTSTIAQIAPGQDVRVTLPAYPVQDYGTFRAVVETVGAAPVADAQPYFLVTARLQPLSERQRARNVVLRPDLALDARIVLARRSFLQWLVDPFAAVARQ
ncbi:HlyD family secretion protein [Sphingobium lignivorans]|uniref:Membrane fusion protein n=1 Tax=Sphingobium lignivorans TaxID=2735886 RepID=A0ABR6NEC8_9SPHN|nr:HlyD family efflux transporter periplasmic adaptor subunit [Sphingobium lignivorans]MBB5985012.1 membrane fusion protein [Sphingobium lignivorans]